MRHPWISQSVTTPGAASFVGPRTARVRGAHGTSRRVVWYIAIVLASMRSPIDAVTVPLGPPQNYTGDAWPTPRRTLWVDRCGRGVGGICGSVACSDGNAGTDQNAPLCTLGKAGDLAQPGDLINVRAGTTPADGYWEPDTFGGRGGYAALHVSIKGTATCASGPRAGWGCTSDASCPESACDYRPIVLAAYDGDGEPVHIDPSGHHPDNMGADQCWSTNYGRYVGLAFGGPGSCAPPAYGGMRNDRTECYGGPDEGKPCSSIADCGSGAVACAARPYYWIVDGFHFTGWNFYDARLNINDGDGTSNGNLCSEKATQIAGPGFGGCPVPVGITFQNNVFERDGGGGVLWAYQSAGNRWFHNRVQNNYTRGYTTAVNHWAPRDAERNRKTYIWGNVISDNYDDPPPWANAGSTPGRKICRPTDPSNPPTFTCIGGDTPGAPCREETDCGWGHCGGICAYDPYYNTSPTNEGYNCECKSEWVDWDGDPVVPVTMCAPGLSCVAQLDTGGGGEPSGNTEGRGIIIDRGGTSSAFDIRNNVIYHNAGDCISVFLSDGGNATLGSGAFSNNTCYHNARKGASFSEINLTARYLDAFNNLIVPSPFATCKTGPAGGQVCTNYGEVGGLCGSAQYTYGCSAMTYFQYDNIGVGFNNYAPALPSSVRTGHDLFYLPLPGATSNPLGFEFAAAGGGEVRNSTFDAYQAYGLAAGLQRAVNSIVGDPLFASEDPHDQDFLKVSVGSPALGAGDPLYAPPFDLEGNPRSDSAPTIGAYEVPAGGGSPATTSTTATSLPTSTSTTTTSLPATTTTSLPATTTTSLPATTTTSLPATTTTSLPATTTTSLPATTTTTLLATTTTTLPPSGEARSLWPDDPQPALLDAGPDGPVELGLKFRSDVAGWISGVRFYKSLANTGPHVASLWTGTGTRLATVTADDAAGEGWQELTFPTPMPIQPDTVYVVSYFCPYGHYSGTLDYFATQGVDTPPLHAPATNEAGGNGVFVYSGTSAFPTFTYYALNYWVDVVFSSSPPPTTTTIIPTTTTTTTTVPPECQTNDGGNSGSGEGCPCTSAAACDDGDACTDDSCDPTAGCRHVARAGCCHEDTDCIDADPCTTLERCESGTCVSSPTVCPAPTDGCLAARCDPAAGCVLDTQPNGETCDDGNACTAGDACDDGSCVGTPIGPTGGPRAVRIRRFDLSLVDGGYAVSASGQFSFLDGIDLGATGITVAFEDGAGRPIVEADVPGSDLRETRSGWALAAPLPGLTSLSVRTSTTSARVSLRATLPAFPLDGADGSGTLRWRMGFGSDCTASLTLICTDGASGDRSCHEA
jgi:hypothetical protein